MNFTRAAVLSTLCLWACADAFSPKKEQRLRIGVETPLVEAGFDRYVQAVYEAKTKSRTQLVRGEAEDLEKLATKGLVDVLVVTSDAVVEKLEKSGVADRKKAFAHEEFVFIGPTKDRFRSHGSDGAVDFLRNVTRSNYRYYIAKRGTAEQHRHARLRRLTKDRQDIGSHLQTNLTSKGFVAEVIKKNGFALVRRSSLVMLAKEGLSPHRVYQDGQPELLLKLWAVTVHPKRTGRAKDHRLFEFLTGEDGKKLISKFGSSQFGLPLYAPGLPDSGDGARVPGLAKTATTAP